MIRANFFYNFFKYNQKSSTKITKYNSYKKFDLEEKMNTEMIEIEKKISENSKALIEAQIVKFRSNFSSSNSFIEKIGKNAYKTKLEDSINWHQKELKELYLRRGELEMNLEKIKGVFWINRLKRFLKIILIGFLIFLSVFVFFSGFMILIYCLPFIIIIYLGYLISTKNNQNRF